MSLITHDRSAVLVEERERQGLGEEVGGVVFGVRPHHVDFLVLLLLPKKKL